MDDWERKESWQKRGKNFCVEVHHHTIKHGAAFDTDAGEHRWCVYAFIYPQHPHFAKFGGDSMWQYAATDLPLHCGCSFLKRHYAPQGKVTSIQVGADYSHLYDAVYTHYADQDEARSVFSDAAALWAWLS